MDGIELANLLFTSRYLRCGERSLIVRIILPQCQQIVEIYIDRTDLIVKLKTLLVGTRLEIQEQTKINEWSKHVHFTLGDKGWEE